MMKFVQIILCYGLLVALLFAVSDARPSTGESGPVSRYFLIKKEHRLES